MGRGWLEYRHKTEVDFIAGPDGGMEKNLEDLTKKLNLTDDIKFTGTVSGQAKQNLLFESDVLLFSSECEGISMVQLEVMCAKCAVVVGNCGGIHEELTRHNTGIVINPNLKELYNAMRSLTTNKELREKNSKNGYNLVKKEFSWDNIVNDYLNLYKNTIVEKYK